MTPIIDTMFVVSKTCSSQACMKFKTFCFAIYNIRSSSCEEDIVPSHF